MINATTFNKTIQGKQVRLYTIKGKNGMEASITNYGAKIVRWEVKTPAGEKRDIVLGFNHLDEWLSQEVYFNGVCGRCAGRISNGEFVLDNKTYQLTRNDGDNSLHGGAHGFNDKVWDMVEQSLHSVRLHYHAEDGEEGYPGAVDVYVTYSLTRDNALKIKYEARAAQPTIINLTNHAYFNLKGEGNGTIHDHILQVMAEEYIPYNDKTLPTGEVLPVEGTVMDFRQPICIGERINDPFFAAGRGIDNGWALTNWQKDKEAIHRRCIPQKAAVLQGGELTMEVWTNCPCLQVYTGNYVEKHQGKSGQTYDVQTAICLEAEEFPDAINQPNFPSTTLRPGKTMHRETIYKICE